MAGARLRLGGLKVVVELLVEGASNGPNGFLSQSCHNFGAKRAIVGFTGNKSRLWQVIEKQRLIGKKTGAGEGNRTLVVSLGSFCNQLRSTR